MIINKLPPPNTNSTAAQKPPSTDTAPHSKRSLTYKKRIFGVSLALNIIFFVLFIGMIVYKWDSIHNKIFSFQYHLPSEKELLCFNNDPIPINEGFLEAESDSTVSMVFLGNSITICTMPEEESDKTKRGLTSTSIYNDYVHRLIEYISNKYNVNVDYSIANLAEFERTFTLREFDFKDKLRNNKISNPDWLIIQLGENVSEKDLSPDNKYREEFARLLSLYPNSKKIVTIPFWPSKAKQRAATQIALDNDCYLVDLSHLGNGTDPSNLALSQRKYNTPGVGIHPGDTGMENIANVIFSIIQADSKESTKINFLNNNH